MKKSLLSLTLLYSVYLVPSAAEPAPESVAQDPEAAQAVAAVEYSEVVPELAKLEEELLWNMPAADRVEIMAALGILVSRGGLNKHNFEERAKFVIAQTVAQRSLVQAQRHLYDRSAQRVANSMGGNVKAMMDRKGIKGSLISEYAGWNLEFKVKTAAHHAEYRHDRWCSDWSCW